MMLLLPATGLAMPQQQTDIKKPTRERVKNNGNKGNNQKTSTDKNKKDNQGDASKKEDKAPAPASKPAAKPDDNTKKNANAAEKPADGAQKDDKSAANEQPVDAKPKTAPIVDRNYNGLDVSKHQGVINWDVVKKDNKIQYVYIKATEGSDRVDEQYVTNLRNARRAGIKVGSYHYLTNRSSVTTQFKNFAMNAPRDQQDLIPVIDVEVCRQWDAQQLRDSLKVFANMLEDYYGCKPIIYTYESFFKKYLGRSFADYPIFIAKYSNELPNINGVKWILWQYSESGRVDGIKGNVDLSRFNKGHSIQEILYRPAKGKPKISVKDAVDRNKPKPAVATLMDQPTQTDKSKEEASKKANERIEKTKAEKEKAEKEKADRIKANKEKAKAEREKAEREKAEKEKAKADRAKANKEKANREKAEREKAEKERAAKVKADREKAEKERAAKAKAEQEAKEKRRAAAKKAREEKTKQNASKSSGNKAASARGALTQSQRNDSIRSAKQSGRKINKSSADND